MSKQSCHLFRMNPERLWLISYVSVSAWKGPTRNLEIAELSVSTSSPTQGVSYLLSMEQRSRGVFLPQQVFPCLSSPLCPSPSESRLAAGEVEETWGPNSKAFSHIPSTLLPFALFSSGRFGFRQQWKEHSVKGTLLLMCVRFNPWGTKFCSGVQDARRWRRGTIRWTGLAWGRRVFL